ncbi:MAG: glycosyltransferase family 2 protein [Caulobacteraceae bacterium]
MENPEARRVDQGRPKVSVVVPHYRDLDNLDQCLAALGRQSFPREEFEIVVADNGSPEGEAALDAVIAGRARWVIVAEKGAGLARNGGVAEARGEILAFTDSDCRPEPEWLAEGLAALADHGFVGGGMKVLVADPERLTPAEAFEKVFAFNNEAYVTRKGFTVTANLFCPRAVFDAVGPFRVGVSEDTDWCLRATRAGYSIGYAPRAVVGHPARRTWRELETKWRRINAENYALFAVGWRGRLLWTARALALPASAVVHAGKVVASPNLASPGQRLAALGMLFRVRLWRCVDALGLLARSAAR